MTHSRDHFDFRSGCRDLAFGIQTVAATPFSRQRAGALDLLRSVASPLPRGCATLGGRSRADVVTALLEGLPFQS